MMSADGTDHSGRGKPGKWASRAVFAALVAMVLASTGCRTSFSEYVHNGFKLVEGAAINSQGVLGILFASFGFMTFTFTLLLHSTVMAVRRRA